MNGKKMLSILTAAALIASMSVSAFAAGTVADGDTFGSTTELEGASTTQKVVKQFSVPTSAQLGFVIDPYQLADETGSQIHSTPVKLLNKSNVPISITVKAKVAAKSGVTVKFVKTPAEAEATDATDTEKKAYMQITPAKPAQVLLTSAKDDLDTTADKIAFAAGDYAKAAKAALTTKDNGEVTFALSAAKYDNTDPDNPSFSEVGTAATGSAVTGGSLFRFMGSVNPNAAWANGDFTVKVVFTVNGMTKDDYKAVKAIANTANVSVLTSATFGPTATAPASVTLDTTFDVGIDLGEGVDAATSVTAVKAGTVTLVKTTDWVFDNTDPDAVKLTITEAGAKKIEGKAVTLTLTFDKGAPKTLNVKIPAAS